MDGNTLSYKKKKKICYLCACRCGKLLRNEDEVQYHAAKTQHSSFSESTDEVKPLSKEEKEAQLAK